MFRVNDPAMTPASSWAESVIRIALGLALIVTVGAAGLIYHEYALVTHWSGDERGTTLASLRQEVRIQFAITLIISVILAGCLAAFWWLLHRDFTSRQSLRQVKILAHDILASMDQGVVTTDLNGIVTSINTAAIELLGVNFECVGQALERISSPELPLVDLPREVGQRQASVPDRYITVARTGRVQRFQAGAHVLMDTQGTALGCVIHLRDVTERMLIEERMRRMERFISLGTLASGLHHEIKNPLTALSIHIQLLEERLSDPAAAEPVDELVGVVKAEVIRLNGVLESFRNFANLQHLAIQPTDVVGLLENTMRLVRPQATQQDVQISLHQSGVKLPPVPLDPAKFEQALLNLVINALEAMPSGGHLTLETRVQDGSLHIDVADTGLGIPPEVQRNLFEPYFSTKDHGTGMGLALSEKLIGQHGGRIDYCTGSRGTTFRISVPLDRQDNGTP